MKNCKINDCDLFILSGFCKYEANDTFLVKFHNSDKFPIDITTFDDSGNEQLLVKRRINPGDHYSHKAFFIQEFFFTRSNTKQSLQASANGVTADDFEGCRFKAEKSKPILVEIYRGIG